VTNTMCWLLIAKKKSSNFMWCIVACICFGLVAWSDENNGQVILNFAWYIPTSIFGFVLWQRYKKQNKKSIIEATKFKLSLDLTLVGIIIVCCAVMTYVETLHGFIKFWNPDSKYVDPTVKRDFIFYFKAFCDASSLMIAVFAMVLLLMRNRLQYPLWIGVETLTVFLWIATWVLNGKPSMADSIQGIWSHTMSVVLDIYGHIQWNKKKVKKDVIEGHMAIAEQDLK
jgi:nicotinamide mononucleotide transporter PnuC